MYECRFFFREVPCEFSKIPPISLVQTSGDIMIYHQYYQILLLIELAIYLKITQDLHCAQYGN